MSDLTEGKGQGPIMLPGRATLPRTTCYCGRNFLSPREYGWMELNGTVHTRRDCDLRSPGTTETGTRDAVLIDVADRVERARRPYSPVLDTVPRGLLDALRATVRGAPHPLAALPVSRGPRDCGALEPDGGGVCDLPAGHTGNHGTRIDPQGHRRGWRSPSPGSETPRGAGCATCAGGGKVWNGRVPVARDCPTCGGDNHAEKEE